MLTARERRAACGLALLVLALDACSSAASRRELAFLEAGRQIRSRAEGQTYAAARRELDLFLQHDVDDVIERAGRRRAKDARLYRALAIAGLAAGVVAGTSGTLGDSGNESARSALTGVGALGVAGGLSLYFIKTAEMDACVTFLEERGRDLQRWGKRSLKDGDELVPRDVWQELVDQENEIQRFPKCLRVR